MEVSEEISDQTCHSDHRKTESDMGNHQPSSSANGDPDPATSDLVRGDGNDDGGIREKIASLDVKETEDEAPKSESDEKEERETAEKDLKESEEEEETRKSESEEEEEEAIAKDLSGEGIGDRSESENGGENDQEGEEKKNEVEDENEVINGGDEPEKKDEIDVAKKYQYPVRPEAEDCSFYLKTGTCKFGSNCKFNHPVRKKTNHHFHV